MNQLNQPKHSRALFFSLLAVLLGLCFIRYALQVNIPMAMLLAVAVLMALLGDRDEIIALCICMIPLDTSIQYTYVLIFCLLLYVVKFGRTIRFNLTIVPVLLMILWELLHCFGEPFSPVTFVANCLPQLLLAVLMCSDGKRFDYDFIVRAFAVSVAAICLCLMGRLLYVSGFNPAVALNSLQRLGKDAAEATLAITGGQQNPNTLGIQCVLAITGLTQLRNSGRKRAGDLALTLFLMVFGALTTSRTYLACLVIMAVLLVFSRKGNITDKLKLVGSLTAALLLVLLVLYAVFPTLLEYYFSRFFTGDITTGRGDLMVLYHKFIMSDPEILFFGVGLYDYGDKVMASRVAYDVPHNGIQEAVIIWGLPGIFLLLLLGLAMITHSRNRNKKQSLLHFIPLLVLLAKVQVGQMLSSVYTMLAFSYAYLSLSADIGPGSDRPKRLSRGKN